jgi:hypothetical protein
VIIAAQTLLSEAYADPASSLPTTASTPTDLYVGGKLFTQVIPASLYTSQFYQTLSSNSLYPIDTNSDDFNALVRTLTNAPLALADDSSALLSLAMDENFNIVAYSYLDPETLSSTTGKVLMVTYNVNIVNNVADYDPTAGLNVWSYNMADGSASKVG